MLAGRFIRKPNSLEPNTVPTKLAMSSILRVASRATPFAMRQSQSTMQRRGVMTLKETKVHLSRWR